MPESKQNYRSPVGKAEAMKGTNGAFTMAVFPASQVPVDAELFVTPSDKRLSLEVEVANENAANHKAECIKRGDTLHRYRTLLRATQLLLDTGELAYLSPEMEKNSIELLKLINKEFD